MDALLIVRTIYWKIFVCVEPHHNIRVSFVHLKNWIEESNASTYIWIIFTGDKSRPRKNITVIVRVIWNETTTRRQYGNLISIACSKSVTKDFLSVQEEKMKLLTFLLFNG